jgi:hypothetical protein
VKIASPPRSTGETAAGAEREFEDLLRRVGRLDGEERAELFAAMAERACLALAAEGGSQEAVGRRLVRLSALCQVMALGARRP